jgi:hypothetical protein
MSGAKIMVTPRASLSGDILRSDTSHLGRRHLFLLLALSRHLVRLAAEFTRDSWSGLATVLLWSIPLTLVAATMLGALVLALEAEDIFSVYFALIAALTVPHVGVVLWQDKIQSSGRL